MRVCVCVFVPLRLVCLRFSRMPTPFLVYLGGCTAVDHAVCNWFVRWLPLLMIVLFGACKGCGGVCAGFCKGHRCTAASVPSVLWLVHVT